MKLAVKSKSFFDAPKVIAATTRAERRVLAIVGSRVRIRARRSIRKRKAPSKPGSPPSSHTGFLRRGIYFGFDFNQRSVVVGPEPYAGRVANILEEGGVTKLSAGRDKGKTIRIEARPFMGPAFKSVLPEVPALWKDSVR